MRSDRLDIHQHITDQILALVEKSRGEFMLPWHVPASTFRPTNVASNKPYRGVNILALWAAAENAGYTSGLWGTYRQWAEAGAQVRRGEKASYIVFYKEAGRGDVDEANTGDARRGDDGDDTDKRKNLRWIARASAVFAVEQVDGFAPSEKPPTNPVKAIEQAETFVAATGAKIVHEGRRAFYRQSTDDIHLPPSDEFVGSKTSTATESYYSTLFHELTHWTGHATRCARDLGRRFGKDAYALEELVAELGASFLCAELQIASEPRPDHAHYIKDWLDVLRADKKAIFTAASQASKAVEFLKGLQPEAESAGDNSNEQGCGPATPTGAYVSARLSRATITTASPC